MAHDPAENTVVKLTPNQLISNSGWDVRGTSSSVTALSDNNADTYVLADRTSDNLKAGFTTSGIPALCQLRSVVVRAYTQAAPSPGQAHIQFHIFIGPYDLDGQVFASSYPAIRDWNSSNLIFSYFPTQADIDAVNMEMTVAGFTVGATQVAVGEVALYLVLNQAPVVTNIKPSAYGTSPGLVVSWGYHDPENNPQNWSLVKAFTVAQYGAAGFDPDASAAAYAVEVKSPSQSRVIPFLADGRYRIYVKVADVDSLKRYGPWSFVEIEVRNRYIQSIV